MRRARATLLLPRESTEKCGGNQQLSKCATVPVGRTPVVELYPNHAFHARRRTRSGANFFSETLGFETLFRAANYAYVHRETVGFRLLEQTGEDGAPSGNRRFAYYIDVHDVDLLYTELKPKLDALPKGDVHGPMDKSYGQ